MESKMVEINLFSSSGRSKETANNVLQEEASELYEGIDYIPGREWARWFATKRLSGSRSKT